MYAKLFIISLFFMVIAIYFVQIVEIFIPIKTTQDSPKLFTTNELKLYNGVNKPQLYLSVLGKVFDVSAGVKHYGPGCSYNFFTGKDSSRSFITGKFDDEHVDDRVADLTPEDLLSLDHWVHFYTKEYKRIGKLTGRYYDENGKLTTYGKEVKKLIKRAKEVKETNDVEKSKYPSCNVEWDAVKGTRVWCTNKSGGVLRDWVGFPRQLYEPGSTDHRCACVQIKDLTTNFKEYEGCDYNSESCFVKTQY